MYWPPGAVNTQRAYSVRNATERQLVYQFTVQTKKLGVERVHHVSYCDIYCMSFRPVSSVAFLRFFTFITL